RDAELEEAECDIDERDPLFRHAFHVLRHTRGRREDDRLKLPRHHRQVPRLARRSLVGAGPISASLPGVGPGRPAGWMAYGIWRLLHPRGGRRARCSPGNRQGLAAAVYSPSLSRPAREGGASHCRKEAPTMGKSPSPMPVQKVTIGALAGAIT